MHAENRYPVTASLFMLKEIKHRQEQVNRGYQLLKRKAEALRMRGRQAALELSSTQAMLGHTLREAYISLAAIKFTNGESNALVLENVGQAQVRVQRIPENISGVSTVALQALEDPGAGDALRYAGLGAGGHRTGEAKKAFREAVLILIKFASLRNTCILLDTSIRSTLRKVNGIEKVIMPKLRNTENYILTEMDEREREEFHRLKMVKAKKIRNQVRSIVRQDDSNVGGGESTGMYHFNMVGVAMVGQMGHLFPPMSLNFAGIQDVTGPRCVSIAPRIIVILLQVVPSLISLSVAMIKNDDVVITAAKLDLSLRAYRLENLSLPSNQQRCQLASVL